MYEAYETLLKERGVKTADVCKETGLRQSMFSDWKKGKYTPKTDKLQKIADYFGVPYDLRHTYCTDLQKAGVDIRTAQKLMGHADIQITANIYTHVDTDQIIAAADLLAQ